MIHPTTHILNGYSLNITYPPTGRCHVGSTRQRPSQLSRPPTVPQIQMLPVVLELQCIVLAVNPSPSRISTIPQVQIKRRVHNPEQAEIKICMRTIKAHLRDNRWPETG